MIYLSLAIALAAVLAWDVARRLLASRGDAHLRGYEARLADVEAKLAAASEEFQRKLAAVASQPRIGLSGIRTQQRR